ncbi:unnamed protein product [Phytophthora fragariaefolia]|uniref:Unnamed protein product n=1 Tax=Phytophthora fragariaefolia TaxID=1490495 RepID=A0A9W6XEA7_9STRA|nr:unnamed protein product [Phytophthora fragariaefolia]
MHPSTRFRLVLLASATAFSTVSAYNGYGTVYGPIEPSGGNCNFQSYPSEVITNYAALNAAQWDSTMNCGRCAEVRCTDVQCVNPSSSSEIVYIIDQCPGCEVGDLDLSPSVFKSITGLEYTKLKIEWDFVTCPSTGSNRIRYCLKEGSNAHWAAIQPTYMSAGVASVRINDKPTTMVASSYYFLLTSDSSSLPDLSSLKITMKSIAGETIEDVVDFSNAKCVEVDSQFSVSGSINTASQATSADQTAASPTEAPLSASTEVPTEAPQTEVTTETLTEAPTEVPQTEASQTEVLPEASTETQSGAAPTSATPSSAAPIEVLSSVVPTSTAPISLAPSEASFSTSPSSSAPTSTGQTNVSPTSAAPTETQLSAAASGVGPVSAYSTSFAPTTVAPTTVDATSAAPTSTAPTETSLSPAQTSDAPTTAYPTSAPTAPPSINPASASPTNAPSNTATNATASTVSPSSLLPPNSTTSVGPSESISTQAGSDSGPTIIVSVVAVLGCLFITVVFVIYIVIKKKQQLNEQLEQEKIAASPRTSRYERDYHANVAMDSQLAFPFTAAVTPQTVSFDSI